MADLIARIEKMADLTDARKVAARKGETGKQAQRIALINQARLVNAAKHDGFSQMVAEGIIGQGEHRARNRAAMLNGPEAGSEPTMPIARLRGTCITLATAARNGHRDTIAEPVGDDEWL